MCRRTTIGGVPSIALYVIVKFSSTSVVLNKENNWKRNLMFTNEN